VSGEPDSKEPPDGAELPELPAESKDDPLAGKGDPATRNDDPPSNEADPLSNKADPASNKADPSSRHSDAAVAHTDLPAMNASESGRVEVAVSKLPASSSGSVDAAMPKPNLPASESGLVDVAMSKRDLPASESGSVDVAMSKRDLPASESGSVDVALSKPNLSASESGSVDVAMSKPNLPASESGSVDVAMSKSDLPASESGSVDIADSQPGIPHAVPAADSQPVASGAVAAVAAAHDTGPVSAGRSKRITKAVQDAVTGGVERLGTSIGTIGEGVSKVGDLSKKVPLVGASVGKLGEGLAKAGESIHALPRVAQTRRGRLLVRSVVVGFAIVFSWIAAIVLVQLRFQNTPDFRPAAEKILMQISQGSAAIEEVYEKSSPRFQEVVLKERFVDLMLDLNATNGKFREITAINETIVTTGPIGRVGRVGLTALYEQGVTKGSIDFHWDQGKWKFLGIGIEVPGSRKITQAERERRVLACADDKGHDVSDQRATCDVRDAAETVLERIRDGKIGDVYDNASDIFKQQETRANFIRIHKEMRDPLGAYKRLLNVTEAKSIGGLTAFFDCVAEFEKSSGVRVVFNFSRPSKTARWQLRSLKVVVPMPRPDEGRALVPPNPDVRVDEPPLLREISPSSLPRPDASTPQVPSGAGSAKHNGSHVPAVPTRGANLGSAGHAKPASSGSASSTGSNGSATAR